MFWCNAHGTCHGCRHGFDRRRFLQGCATATVAPAGPLAPGTRASAAEPGGEQNGFHIRTSHARVGAVVESLMPAGDMTASFRTNVARRHLRKRTAGEGRHRASR